MKSQRAKMDVNSLFGAAAPESASEPESTQASHVTASKGSSQPSSEPIEQSAVAQEATAENTAGPLSLTLFGHEGDTSLVPVRQYIIFLRRFIGDQSL